MLQIRDEPNRRQKRRTAHHSADAYCKQFRWPVAVFAQKVFFPEPKEVERYHRFPRRAVTLWPARMQAVFNLPVYGVETLCLIAGREQASARSGGNTRHNSGSFGRQEGQGSGAGRRVCRTSAENPGYKVTFAGAKGQHNSCLRRGQRAARRAIYGTKCDTSSIEKPSAYLLKGRMAGKCVTFFNRPGLWYKKVQISLSKTVCAPAMRGNDCNRCGQTLTCGRGATC